MGVGGWLWSGAGLPDHIPGGHVYLPSNAAALDVFQETNVEMSFGAPKKGRNDLFWLLGWNMKTRWAMCREKFLGKGQHSLIYYNRVSDIISHSALSGCYTRSTT